MANMAPRRTLDFDSLDSILADAERAVRTGAACVGQWSLGQILEHLARTMDASLDGFRRPAPWLIRVLARPFRGRFLRRKMSAGFRLPAAAAEQLVPASAETEAALAHLKRSIGRLQAERQRHPHPVLGQLSREEWNQLHQRHAELHLSFARIERG